jgi:hypothetical protein
MRIKRYLYFTIALLLFTLPVFELGADDSSVETAAKYRTKAPDNHFFGQVETNLSFLGQFISGNTKLGSFAYAGRIGWRKNPWDLYVVVEHGLWRDVESADEDSLSLQVLDLGLGAGYSYFNDNMCISLAAGPSVLLTRSQLDAPGSTGFFFDFRPAGFRWRPGKAVSIELYPLTFALVVPVLTGIPLVYMSYRTVLLIGFET